MLLTETQFDFTYEDYLLASCLFNSREPAKVMDLIYKLQLMFYRILLHNLLFSRLNKTHSMNHIIFFVSGGSHDPCQHRRCSSYLVASLDGAHKHGISKNLKITMG